MSLLILLLTLSLFSYFSLRHYYFRCCWLFSCFHCFIDYAFFDIFITPLRLLRHYAIIDTLFRYFSCWSPYAYYSCRLRHLRCLRFIFRYFTFAIFRFHFHYLIFSDYYFDVIFRCHADIFYLRWWLPPCFRYWCRCRCWYYWCYLPSSSFHISFIIYIDINYFISLFTLSPLITIRY